MMSGEDASDMHIVQLMLMPLHHLLLHKTQNGYPSDISLPKNKTERNF